MTLQPDGKTGVSFSNQKCDQIRQAIITSLDEQSELTFYQLGDFVRDEFASEFEGAASWYYTTVKLDLEARGAIEGIGSSSPQKIRLAS